MTQAFLGLGSNKGDRLLFLRRAAGELSHISGIKVGHLSGVYETEPYGLKDQADFLNAVVEIQTTLTPEKLAEVLAGIERSVGQKADMRWGPREIDIDLLFFDSQILERPSLTLPHPEASKRRFVLVPLADIASEFRDPVTGLAISTLLDRCTDDGRVTKTTMTLTTSTSNES